MKYVFASVGLLALLASLGTCAMSKGAIQDTSGAVVGIIATLAFGFASMIETIQECARELRDAVRSK